MVDTAVLTAVSVANGSAINSITSSMSSTLTSSGDIHNVSVTLTCDAGSSITVNGVAVTSATAFLHDFSDARPLTIVVTQDASSNTYKLTVVDGILDSSVATIARVGWFAARCFTGDLDAYSAGGIALPLGNFKPRFVINVQVTDGFIGEYDIATQKLKVYSAAGTEASAGALGNSHFNVILME